MSRIFSRVVLIHIILQPGYLWIHGFQSARIKPVEPRLDQDRACLRQWDAILRRRQGTDDPGKRRQIKREWPFYGSVRNATWSSAERVGGKRMTLALLISDGRSLWPSGQFPAGHVEGYDHIGYAKVTVGSHSEGRLQHHSSVMRNVRVSIEIRGLYITKLNPMGRSTAGLNLIFFVHLVNKLWPI